MTFARRDGALAGAFRVAARRGTPPLWVRARDHAGLAYWPGVSLFGVLRDAGASDRSRTFSVAMRSQVAERFSRSPADAAWRGVRAGQAAGGDAFELRFRHSLVEDFLYVCSTSL